MKPDAAERLAKLLLDFDEDIPGDPDAEVCVPCEDWQAWIDLAGQIDQ